MQSNWIRINANFTSILTAWVTRCFKDNGMNVLSMLIEVWTSSFYVLYILVFTCHFFLTVLRDTLCVFLCVCSIRLFHYIGLQYVLHLYVLHCWNIGTMNWYLIRYVLISVIIKFICTLLHINLYTYTLQFYITQYYTTACLLYRRKSHEINYIQLIA